MVNEKPAKVVQEEEKDLPYHDHPFIASTISALDAEYARSTMKLLIAGSNEDQHRQITAWLIDQYLNFKASTFFTMQSMGELTNFVFENDPIRDFALNVTERACVSAGTLQGREKSIDFVDTFIEKMLSGIETNHSDPTNPATMAPPAIAHSVHVDKEIIEMAVKQNKWLLVCFTMFMYIEQSEMFQQVLKDLTATKKSEKK